MLKKHLCILLFILNTAFSVAGINTWTYCTAYRATIGYLAVAINPLDENKFYCTDGGSHSFATSLYRSTDKGNTWSFFSHISSQVMFMDFSLDTQVMYLSSYSEVLISQDEGLTYYISTSKISGNIYSFMASRHNPRVAYTGANTVYKTTDQGSTWTAASTGLDTGWYVTAIAEDPHHENILYATKENGYVFKSIDGGNSWSSITTGMTPSIDSWRDIAVHPTESNILFAVPNVTGCIYKSFNGGESWSAITSGVLFNGYLRSLAFLPSNPSTMFLTSGYDMIQSFDEGSTWHRFNNTYNPYPLRTKITKSMPHTIFVGGGSGAYTYTIVDTSVDVAVWQKYDYELPEGLR